jgi:glutaredoxin
MEKAVTIFTRPAECSASGRKSLSQKHIPFQERDVTKDAGAINELQHLGYMTTPVTVIGEAVIVGFDVSKIDAALSS